jgi:hypothetical protein
MKRKLMTMVAAASLATGLLGQTVQAAPLSKDPAVQGVEAEGAFPAAFCQPGYFQTGPRLCMTGARGPRSLANAFVDCQDIKGRIADYSDWRYRVVRFGGGVPVGFWLGQITADNTGLFINQADTGDFDGETNRFQSRFYVCAHDDNF